MSVDDGLLRIKMQNGEGGVVKASKHNKRKLAAHSGANAERSHLNYALRGPSTPEEVAALAKRLMADAGILKLKRKDSITAIEVVSSLPVGSAIDPMAYFPRFVEFIEVRFGAHNILSADVHMDEAAPHCHVLILPLAGNKLDASGIVGGPSKVNELHDAFYADFASSFGLRRPPAKLFGNAKATGAKLVLERLKADADAAMVSSIWPEIRADIERCPDPYMARLGIRRPVSAKPVKTFEQIATGTGAGPKTAAGEAHRDRNLGHLSPTHRGVDGGFDTLPLPCGGVAQFSPSFSSPTEHWSLGTDRQPASHTRRGPRGHTAEKSDSVQHTPSPVRQEQVTTRHRDDEQTPETWDSTSGEFISGMPPPTYARKAAADAWVRGRLGRQ